MRPSLRVISNLPRKDTKQSNTTSFMARFNNLPPTTLFDDDDSEYSDPDVIEDSSAYDDDDDDDDDDLPAVDRRNLNKPAKLAKYAETIFSIARQDISSLTTSSEQFRLIQKEITPTMHETAVRWIMIIQKQYGMSNDTLYEAVTYLDTILSKWPVREKQLQMVAVTCTWMAAKIEERSVPKLEELSYMCSNEYKADDFVKCERKLLRILDFRLSFPTSKFFLRRLLDSIDAEQNVIEAASFFCDLALFPICFMDYSPNIIALAAVCLGKLCLNEFCPTLRLMAYAHIEEIDEVRKCANSMLSLAPKILNNPKHVLHSRYSNSSTQSVFQMTLSLDLNKLLSTT
ncbi:Cyclin, N-terminal domain containing protein [Tritrichomonas foetus]|uniref:Cyclin, N-terminal domain containing protein n=1 Tax=Tritrichomonas foetus TaxID=1144522 RepID=A0A1J4JRM3_9EUKA|nr:Cyclin, N-terminal domain containing protein [Tritrichomonas foetus]|eukprot:OHT01769.1 Cyclin, N-terminal domain containing protein [Tritrichomonas foetus]